ncbi:hypothetical protein LAZ67_3004793 [Cordylochernes scorpioides]|uniref:Uncharacterized protein n=1 Tax=Cordylochernes scorpioides TaxID=51811 RepID=A0ABY6K9Q7_9ARAC|nr:hypothetical protein LAZ67_3004793 [Cordylochernes scorpioides]
MPTRQSLSLHLKDAYIFGSNILSVPLRKRFENGRTSVADDIRCGQPKMVSFPENIEKLKPRITIIEVSEKNGVAFGICHSIIHYDLGQKIRSCKFVPRILTLVQKETRKEICENLLKLAVQEQMWQHKVITEEETWVYGDDPETKRQSS